MRIWVVRALPGLGDLLCVVPALRALRRARPSASISVVGLPNARMLIERFPQYVDAIVPFEGWPGIPEVPVEPGTIVRFLAGVHREPPDMALQMHGSGIASAGFTSLLGARDTAGFVPAGIPTPPGRWVPLPEELPEPLRWLALLELVGIPAAGTELEFPVREQDVASVEIPRQPFVVVHAGSSTAARRWDPEGFAAVADELASRGLQVVLTGTEDEQPVAADVASGMSAPAVDLCGQTSLGGLAALLSRAAVVVANDTGPSHLASAVGAPSVVIHVGSDAERWAPLDGERHRSIPGPPHAPMPSADAVLREALTVAR